LILFYMLYYSGSIAIILQSIVDFINLYSSMNLSHLEIIICLERC
jgi:hypothetical protein